MKVLHKNRVWDKEAIQELLDKNDAAVARALMVIYSNQTQDERTTGDTYHRNNIGFTGNDAEALSDIAEKWKRWGRWASPRQANFVRRRIRKYHRQLLEHMLAMHPEARKIDAREAKRIAAETQVSQEDHIAAETPKTAFHEFAA